MPNSCAIENLTSFLQTQTYMYPEKSKTKVAVLQLKPKRQRGLKLAFIRPMIDLEEGGQRSLRNISVKL